MKERIQRHARSRVKRREAPPPLHPIDAFVLGGDVDWNSAQNLWVLLSRPGERLLDFFLEDADFQGSPDPVPCACAGVLPDGTLLVGPVDWERDAFLSEMLDAEAQQAPRPSRSEATVFRTASRGRPGRESRGRDARRRR